MNRLLVVVLGVVLALALFHSPALAQTGFDCSSVTAVPQGECQALVTFYQSTGGPSWANHTGWLADQNPCLWNGVTCENGHVKTLQLIGNGLSGSLPPALGNLPNLQVLFVPQNGLTGSIPAELGNLTALQTLSLGMNQLTGGIPPALGNLGTLQVLSLANNRLTGGIPAELGNLTSLTQLSLSSNQLTGSIPATLGSLAKLQYLLLANNQLAGGIPTQFGNLSSLRQLYLGDNQLTGIIPAELGSLGALETLSLDRNSLSGAIPATLSQDTKLKTISADGNSLSGSIPPQLATLPALQALFVRYNQLSGSIPAELGNMPSLQYLYLRQNQLSGSIPPALGNLAGLLDLDLSKNQLTGAIPAELGTLAKLKYLDLGENSLSGPIPAQLGNDRQLQYLILISAGLSGGVPSELGNLTLLNNLLIANNPALSGPLPLSLTATHPSYFWYSNTALCGPRDPAFQTWLNAITVHPGTGICNVTPTVNIGGPYNVDEGGSVTLEATASDADGDPLTYSWDLNNDGAFEGPGTAAGASISFSAAGRDGPASWPVAVKVCDNYAACKVASTTVEISNVAPTISSISFPDPIDEGTPGAVTVQASDPGGAGDVLSYLFDCNGDGTYEVGPQSSNSATCTSADGPNQMSVGVRVMDGDGGQTDQGKSVTVRNLPPAITSVTNDGPANESSSASVTVQAQASDPAGANDPLSYFFDCDGNGSYEIGPQASASATCSFADSGSYTVNVQVSDDDDGSTTGLTAVTINNLPPAVGAITAPADPTLVNTAVNASASFTDAGTGDTHTAQWNWGDGSASAGIVSESSGSGSVSGAHTYTAAGVYTLSLTVTDDESGSGQSPVYQYLVIYAPANGFITGSGSIYSPAGAYSGSGSSGKALFGFVVRYQQGATVPDGRTSFRLPSAGFAFQSTGYDWLAVSSGRAQLKGVGTVNGAGTYSFLLNVLDGSTAADGIDRFRMKVWDKASGAVIYDNEMGSADNAVPNTAVDGGSIVVHPQ